MQLFGNNDPIMRVNEVLKACSKRIAAWVCHVENLIVPKISALLISTKQVLPTRKTV